MPDPAPEVLGRVEPVFDDGLVRLYHGDALALLDVIAEREPRFDCAIVDPPYGETSLEWDRWVEDWPSFMTGLVRQMWCFGSFRMFHEHAAEFADWKLAQEVVWEKHNGSSFHADRFKRVHELAVHFYRGEWSDLHREVQTTPDAVKKAVRKKGRPAHTGHIDATPYYSEDGGPRIMRSVLQVRSCHGYAVHPTQKPEGILEPLIAYSCPIGGTVFDPFAGSASTLVAARNIGRRAVGIEANAEYVDRAIRRLEQAPLDLYGVSDSDDREA